MDKAQIILQKIEDITEKINLSNNNFKEQFELELGQTQNKFKELELDYDNQIRKNQKLIDENRNLLQKNSYAKNAIDKLINNLENN